LPQESKVIEDKLTKEVCLVDGYQSFWAVSRWVGGGLGGPAVRFSSLPPRLHEVSAALHLPCLINCLWGCLLAFACREKKGYSGVTTYASTGYAPLASEVDSLGSGEDDIDREGR
jgi:hypothetical protein